MLHALLGPSSAKQVLQMRGLMAPAPVPAGAPSASSAGEIGPDYGDESITIPFALHFNAVQTGLWWLLWLSALAYAFYRRRIVSRAWFVYIMLLSVLLCNGIQTSAYTGYAVAVEHGGKGAVGYLIYLAFFNLGRSGFLVRSPGRTHTGGARFACTRVPSD